MSVRHDWYQSEEKVVVAVMLKNANEKKAVINIERERVHVQAEGYELDVQLNKPIVVERSTYKIFATKVEITLAKETGDRWDTLEKKSPQPVTAAPPPIHKKNWDSLAKEVDKLEEEEAQSEEALHNLFKKIYKTSNPEVKKAMNKSFQESNGTVLSTNWSEVSQKTITAKPPDGIELKKWD